MWRIWTGIGSGSGWHHGYERCLLSHGWTPYLQVREGFEGPCCGTHYHLNEKLRQSQCLQRLHRIVRRRKKPQLQMRAWANLVSSGERSYPFSTQTSPTSPSIDCGRLWSQKKRLQHQLMVMLAMFESKMDRNARPLETKLAHATHL